MPDHVHLLVFVDDHKAERQMAVTERQITITERPAAVPCTTGCKANTVQNKRIPHYVGTLKRFVNREIGENIWQKSYYDTVIRSREEYNTTWDYIDHNPWNADEE